MTDTYINTVINVMSIYVTKSQKYKGVLQIVKFD